MISNPRARSRAVTASACASHSSICTEVDFLLGRGRDWLALEVKTASRIGPDHLRGLRAIDGLRGLRRRILLYMGARRLRTEDGIDVWSVRDFLAAVEGNTLWP